MQVKVSGETPFKVCKDQVFIGPSASGYTLAYGAAKDGTFTSYSEATPANENLIVNGVVQYCWLKLVGNSSEVDVIL